MMNPSEHDICPTRRALELAERGQDSVEPEPPRLSIFHFLVGTAFVAVNLGMIQALQLLEDPPYRILALLGSIGNGLSVAGLLLWPTCHFRGITFPKHPGEHLLVVRTFGALIGFIQTVLTRFVGSMEFIPWMVTYFILTGLPMIIANLWAARRIKHPGWRMLFLLSSGLFLFKFIAYLVGGWAMLGNFSYLYQFIGYIGGWGNMLDFFYYLPGILPGSIAVFLVIHDHRRRIRYPWPHWLGVAILFWGTLISISMIVVAFSID